MTPGGRAQGLIELLQIFNANKNVPADTVLSRYLKERRYIGSKDRQFLAHHFFQVLRMHHALKGKTINERLLVARYFAWIGQMPMSEITYWFDGSHYHPHILTKEEIKFIGNYSYNQIECIPAWVRALLPNAESIVNEVLLTPASIDIRVNLFKNTIEDVLSSLNQEGFYCPERMKYSKVGLRLKRRLIYGHPLLQDGQIEFQDEGAQIISFLVDSNDKMHVLDLCAGAGGKSLSIANVMENKGEIILSDIHEFRLKRAKERLAKAGVFNAQIVSIEKLPKKQYDRVLLDVPCSGSGTWRRKPDLLMKITPEIVQNVMEEQRQILERSVDYVKVGGRLIYATCSLFDCENADQVNSFMQRHPNFKPVNLNRIQSAYLNRPFEGEFLKLTPWEHGCDGFFVSVLEKVA